MGHGSIRDAYVFGISSILRLMPCAIANREDAADKVSGTGLELV
jgi:hypothetical protein